MEEINHVKNTNQNVSLENHSNSERVSDTTNRTEMPHNDDIQSTLSRLSGDREKENAISPDELLDEDWCRLDNASGSDGTATASTSRLNLSLSKVKNENDTFDERDRFSPTIGFTINLQETEMCNNIDNNEQNNRRPLNEAARLSSKEEKQRQNEEIVIMESSSVSSETGSWESIFPQRGTIDIEPKDSCTSFLNNEQRFCSHESSRKCSKESDDEKPISSASETTPLEPKTSIPKMATSIGACFIDASTLLDDGESSFINSYQNSPAPERRHSHELNSVSSAELQRNEMIEEKVEKSEDANSIVTTNVPNKSSSANSVLNMSDEQKLHTKSRDTEPSLVPYDIKDQYASESSLKESRPVALQMLNDYSRDNSKGSTERTNCTGNDRQDQERKQGHFLFQNSIQQFSGHAMSPKVPYTEDNNSDFSLPSVYSGSSDPYNDCASVFDTSSHHSSNYGDRDSHDYSTIYPDTPHNSILNVNLYRNSSVPSDSAIASLSSSESTGTSIPRTKKSHRRDEDSVPIVSGGASIKDFTPKQCDSPIMHRKTEDSPIISLGLTSADFELRPKSNVIDRHNNTAINSWVVDMSDCNKKNRRRGSESSSTSTDYSGGRFSDSRMDRSGSGSSHKGLGFYVSLSDMKPPRLAEETLSKSLNYHTTNATNLSEPKKKSTGFFVDFSNSGSNATNTPPPVNSDAESTNKNGDDKKNIFSMFIDFGEEKKTNGRRDSLSGKLATAIPKEVKPSFEHETNSPVLIRRNPSAATEDGTDVKRHSWNTSKPTETASGHVREHKRSISTSSEKGIMSIIDKIPLLSKTSSMSIDTPNSPYDDFTCSKSLSSYSINSLTSLSIHSSVGGNMPETNKRHQKDAKINETFDKSSQGSLTDGILSKNSSPTSNTDTDDVTFHNENDETLRGTSMMMETIPETKEAVVLRRPQTHAEDSNAKIERHTMETLQATIEKQKQLLNTVTEEVTQPSKSFVKLSDMDKPGPKFELHHAEARPKSVGSRIGKLFDHNKVGSRNTWHHMSKSTGNNLTNLASSVENLRSLTRIFPHLGKDLSNSLPANFDQDVRNLSPNEYGTELFQSDLSTSSATSSISRSGMDSADEFSLSCRQPRRLGEDLLKMFLQEIATDVVIDVNGRRMKAHKCILRSRCQYFAAILAGGWVESAGNIISLSGYSYGSVQFALCHIYSGASHPPEGISLMELAALADLLGLEGLKEVAAYSLKINYCHSFHKPCSGCIDGVMQVFPVSLNQGLDDLYRKCLRWSCKHYMKVWPSRSFSQLPSELVNRCKQHIIAHMTSDSIIYTLLDCDQLLALLAPCRWATNIEHCVRDIIEAGHDYVADHFASLIASDGFLSLGQGQSWNISRLENMLLRMGSTLTPDQACRSYQRITRLNSVLNAKINKLHTSRIDKNIFKSDYGNDDDQEEDELDWNPEFIRLVGEILSAVEQCLIRQCSRAMKCIQWQRMDAELRNKIQKLACLSEPVERRSRSGPKPVTYSPVITHTNRAHDLYQVKMAIQAHSRRSQDGQSTKPTNPQVKQEKNAPPSDRTNHINNEKKSSNAPTGKISKSTSRIQVPDLISMIKPSKSKSNVPIKTDRVASTVIHRRSASETNNRHITKDKSTSSVDAQLKKPGGLQEIKSRYLEPKRPPIANNKDLNVPLKLRNLSSSGSSRTTSPVISNRRKDMAIQNNRNALNDSITMSRDSLASPAKKNDKALHKVASREHDLSVDSLGNSLRSSIITNKTISQESLIKPESRKSTDLNLKTKSNIEINQNSAAIDRKSHPIKSSSTTQLKTNALILHTPSANSSTPSSITVKSRLSANSTTNSPRDSYKGRHTTPANSMTAPTTAITPKTNTKKSFLSARSRQILAQKKSLSHSDSAKSVPTVIKEKSIVVNKSSSTSNILNGRPNSFATTLHLRRTAKIPPPPSSSTKIISNGQQQHSLMNPTKSSALKIVAQNNKVNRDNFTKETKRIMTKHENEHEYSSHDSDMQMDKDDIHNAQPPIRIESKLERSSTFCKERSDILTSELQIID